MKGKWTPHIIAVTTLAVFIVLGLACATTSDPFMYDVKEKNNVKSISIYGYKYYGKYYETIDLDIPETIKGIPVTVIRPDAFAFVSSKFYLNRVTIPSSVTTIGDSAFAGTRLATITIPEGVTTIGKYAFANNNLTNVTIPSTVTTIGDHAFENNKLTSVNIPSGVTTIGYSAFKNNELTSVTISEGVTTIGMSAFEDNRLTNVTIPSSVSKIGKNAFNRNLFDIDNIAYIESHSIDENARKAYEAGNDLADKKDYSGAISIYRAVLKTTPSYPEAQNKLNTVWNLRVNANPQLYPAPFQGTWEQVIQQKEEKNILVPAPNSSLGGTLLRTQYIPEVGIRVEFKGKDFTIVRYTKGYIGRGRTILDENVHEVDEITTIASGTFYYSNDYGMAYSDKISIPTVIELQSGHILGFNGTLVYLYDYPMKRIK